MFNNLLTSIIAFAPKLWAWLWQTMPVKKLFVAINIITSIWFLGNIFLKPKPDFDVANAASAITQDSLRSQITALNFVKVMYEDSLKKIEIQKQQLTQSHEKIQEQIRTRSNAAVYDDWK